MRDVIKYFQLRSILLVIFSLPFFNNQATAAAVDEPGNIVARINGEPIYEEEYEFIKQGLRSDCITYFVNKYGTYDRTDFWEHSFKGEIPRLWLKEKILEKCKDQKARLSVMNQYGILIGFNYEVFTAKWRQENIARESEVKKGGLVYGTIDFDQQTYYSYIISKSILDTEREIVRRSNFSEKQWSEYYETIKTKKFRKLPSKEIVLYRRSNGMTDSLNVKFEASGSKTDELEWGEIYSRALSLNKVGQFSDRFCDVNRNDCIIKCISITDNGFFPYQEVIDNVKMLYAEEIIHNLSKRMKEQCTVEVYDENDKLNLVSTHKQL
ncbi:hypothetical protein SNE25_08405 [Mucilaginibacter sabulilitoris]|uniref:GLPGLI family protein n=1 Tax=Mucilaginibacter sabulilitoris TaxID=1173583 RepID=A0ABZ0TSV4_9SPHI|nr:hypothetical protein [Mucilaginibacter sabulilitoris]WPU95542.1 hypothetical protein SNE25_08405 [Mucilaginibacter sabulilitoris]